MKRALIIIVVVAVIAGGVYAWRQYSLQESREEMLASLQTEAAIRGPLVSTIGATGMVRSNQTAVLNWQTSGTVERVLVGVGDQVVGGQEFASLAQTSLPQNVILAQADLVNAQQSLEDLMNYELRQATALQAVDSAQQALDDLLNPELQQALTLQAIADAEQAVDIAETRLRNLQSTKLGLAPFWYTAPPTTMPSLKAKPVMPFWARGSRLPPPPRRPPTPGSPVKAALLMNRQRSKSASLPPSQ